MSVLVLALLVGSTSAVQAARRTVAGVVTAASTGQPIAGIVVCAESETELPPCTKTTADGRYSLSAPATAREVTAHEPYLYGTWVDASRPLPASSRAATVDFAMRRGARVGLWLASDGVAISQYMSVHAYRLDASGRPVRVDSFSNLNVDPDGSRAYAEVAKLAPGTYVLRVEWNGDQGTHAQTWYPAAATASAATRITVVEAEARQIDDMPLQPPGRLAVAVTGPRGGRSAASVRIFDQSGREVPEFILHPDRRSNVTTVSGLPAGRYRVLMTENSRATKYSQWYPRATSLGRARDVVVRAGALSQVSARLAYRSPKVLKRPRIRHEGFIIRATSLGAWSPAPRRREILWYRDGEVTDWVGRNFGVRQRDVGHRIKVCVVTHRAGWGNARTCSAVIRPRNTYRD